ncbi:hypothetical protein [Microbacterium sp. zg-YB36]|uniref:hypothetical protein n=1 Tax=Microbacterium sp. zg-YB36 TaxID=2969407 RepID=UPI00214B3BD1|nr:hypothetical protein [Microbacterium sp. zg-YB36]MDL5351179.1 hypothetical protein [Microbacterium sp. zg-YB36]
MTEPTVQKRGYRVSVSEEMLAMMSGFPRKGHYEPVTPTPEQVAQHARAKAVLEELEVNPYLYVGRMEEDITLEPLETERWVPDETTEEWLERYRAARAAGEPMESPFTSMANSLAQRVLAVYPPLAAVPDTFKGVGK